MKPDVLDSGRRWSTEKRFTARRVASTDSPYPTDPRDRFFAGTWAITSTYPLSFNGVLKTVGELNREYKVERPTVVHAFRGPGGVTAYRWSWERLTSWGGRLTDTLWVTGDWS